MGGLYALHYFNKFVWVLNPPRNKLYSCFRPFRLASIFKQMDSYRFGILCSFVGAQHGRSTFVKKKRNTQKNCDQSYAE